MKRKIKLITTFVLSFCFLFALIPTNTSKAASNQKLLVGFWHNFDNGTGIIPLKNVSDKWDVINVSFGETYSDRAVVEFQPCYDKAAFKEDIKYLQSKGKKVLLSIGGQNGVVYVQTAAAKDKFVNSLIGLIDEYGFDGVDIDLETGISLDGGDTDFKNPKTPQLVNLIDALKTLHNKYGSNFVLTMAPEIAYVQGGITAYGNIWGAYLPLIYNLRNELTYLYVQHYNAGGNAGLDGNFYQQGTADFEVAMADMLLSGFPIANNPNNMFPPLREDQVMIGIPACPSAAPSGGYINPTEMKKALDYILYGKSFGGKYKLSKESGFPGFKGLMTWSINWDAKSNFEFSNNYRAYFDGITPPINTLKAASLSASSVINNSLTLTGKVPNYNTATSYKFMDGNTIISSGNITAGNNSEVTLTANASNLTPGDHNFTLDLSDGSKTVSSNTVKVTVLDPSNQPTLQSATLSSTEVSNGNFTLKGVVPSNNLAASYKFFEGTTNIGSGNLTVASSQAINLSLDIQNKTAGTYDYTLVLYGTDGKSVTSNKVTITIDKSSSTNWIAWTNYKVGDIVTYNGKTYECRQPHTALPGWEPSNVPALWILK